LVVIIAGLDPAGPHFGNWNPALRLDPTDAKYVDVIHTDAGMGGTPLLAGHIDFFPNGGESQPGCLKVSSEFYVLHRSLGASAFIYALLVGRWIFGSHAF